MPARRLPAFRSLRARVIVWVSVTLTVLFAITIVGLDLAFRRSTDEAQRQLLEVQLFGLIALAETDEADELTLPNDEIDAQFQVPGSGLYGVLLDADGRPVWQSRSLLGASFPVGESLPGPGEQRYSRVDPPDLPPVETFMMAVTWEFADGHAAPYTFGIASSLEPLMTRQAAFRRNLIGWFAGITIAMLALIGSLLGWVLRPLRRLERQVREVDAGERVALTGEFPSELEPLAASLNALIDTERRRLVRYRNTLDDLAHSLKTPLAVMRTLLSELAAKEADAPSATALDALNREIDRMEQRVSYQLRRARVSGATGLGVEPVQVAPVLEDLRLGLDKVYRDKGVACELAVAPGTVFQGDPGDLTEVLGNLVDNAYKYCRHRVRVTASSGGGKLSIVVADDGRGIEPDDVTKLLERGTRADESVPGHGIGLAVVRDIVELYGGTLAIERSVLGGAAVLVEFTRARAAGQGGAVPPPSSRA
ncbi:MAG TPA: ATP-binding protein [Gammaproteobacteria bacterium]